MVLLLVEPFEEEEEEKGEEDDDRWEEDVWEECEDKDDETEEVEVEVEVEEVCEDKVEKVEEDWNVTIKLEVGTEVGYKGGVLWDGKEEWDSCRKLEEVEIDSGKVVVVDKEEYNEEEETNEDEDVCIEDKKLDDKVLE